MTEEQGTSAFFWLARIGKQFADVRAKPAPIVESCHRILAETLQPIDRENKTMGFSASMRWHLRPRMVKREWRSWAAAMSLSERKRDSHLLPSPATLHGSSRASNASIEHGRETGREPADMYSTTIKRRVAWQTVQLCEAMAAIDAAAAKLCEGLNDERLTWTPCRGRWSIVQNLAHLRITTQVFLPAVDEALETYRKLQLHSDGPFRLTPYGRLLVWRMDARPVIKMQAPKAIRPQLTEWPAQELAHFLLSQAAMRQRMENAEGLHLTALRFPSPLARYVRVNLLEFFSMFNAHSRRHLRQAANVRDAMPGPIGQISGKNALNSIDRLL